MTAAAGTASAWRAPPRTARGRTCRSGAAARPAGRSSPCRSGRRRRPPAPLRTRAPAIVRPSASMSTVTAVPCANRAGARFLDRHFQPVVAFALDGGSGAPGEARLPGSTDLAVTTPENGAVNCAYPRMISPSAAPRSACAILASSCRRLARAIWWLASAAFSRAVRFVVLLVGDGLLREEVAHALEGDLRESRVAPWRRRRRYPLRARAAFASSTPASARRAPASRSRASSVTSGWPSRTRSPTWNRTSRT